MKMLLRILLWVAAIAVFFAALAFGCVYLLECIGPGMAAERIGAMTGFRLDIASLKLSLVKCSAEIDDASIRNPKAWPEDGFVTIDRAAIDVKPLSFIGDRRREIEELAIEIGPINLVTDSHGKNNVEEFLNGLKAAEGQAAPTKEEKPSGEKKAEKPPRGYVIHHLVLKTTSLRYIDYSTPNAQSIVIPFACEIEMHEVTDFKQVEKKLLSKFHRSFLWGILESTEWYTGGC
jgi:hypothetical protein